MPLFKDEPRNTIEYVVYWKLGHFTAKYANGNLTTYEMRAILSYAIDHCFEEEKERKLAKKWSVKYTIYNFIRLQRLYKLMRAIDKNFPT